MESIMSKTAQSTQQTVSLSKLAQMAGFPEELIVEELLLGDNLKERGSVHLSDLREAMVRYLNNTMINEEALS